MGDFMRWAVDNPMLSIPLAFFAWTTLVWKPKDPHGHTYKHGPRGSKGYESRLTRRMLAHGRAQKRREAISKRKGW